MMERRMLVDTTLRDGEQRSGIAFRPEDKIAIASVLNDIGVYEIEAGTPCMDEEELDCIKAILSQKRNSKISVWSRMKPEDMKIALSCKPDIIHIGAPISYVQIYNKLKKNKTWLEKTLLSCIDFANNYETDVTVGFEDASRADVGFMISLIKKMKGLGISTIRLADTVGILDPNRTEKIIHEILEQVEIDIEIHTHNDLGMALANSIVGAKAGAKYVDCTLLGIGERSGNCDLRKLLSATKYLFDFQVNSKKIKEAEMMLQNILISGGMRMWEI